MEGKPENGSGSRPTRKLKIFIVEDEQRIGRFLEIELQHEGYETAREIDGKQALERIREEQFDLVLLDLMLPSLDGMDVCRGVREFSDVPIIMLTARDEIEARVNGLDIGADDYMTKPFAIEELMARIRNALRKHTAQEAQGDDSDKLFIMDLVMYPKNYEVRVAGKEVQLTRREYDLLAYLLTNKRQVLTRDQILQEVWGYDYTGDTNVVDVYIRYLRSKIDDVFQKKYKHTVRGVG